MGHFKIMWVLHRSGEERAEEDLPSTRGMQLVKRFMAQLDKDFREKKLVSDYARSLHLTPAYLNSIIKKNTGYSASHHIRQRIVLEAQRMVLSSDVSMKEIAYELGFYDMSHFSKLFKSVTGNSFTQFRKACMLTDTAHAPRKDYLLNRSSLWFQGLA
jgi:AraC family transcriptional activator of pobA